MNTALAKFTPCDAHKHNKSRDFPQANQHAPASSFVTSQAPGQGSSGFQGCPGRYYKLKRSQYRTTPQCRSTQNGRSITGQGTNRQSCLVQHQSPGQRRSGEWWRERRFRDPPERKGPGASSTPAGDGLRVFGPARPTRRSVLTRPAARQRVSRPRPRVPTTETQRPVKLEELATPGIHWSDNSRENEVVPSKTRPGESMSGRAGSVFRIFTCYTHCCQSVVEGAPAISAH